jgi:hypothetical protein
MVGGVVITQHQQKNKGDIEKIMKNKRKSDRRDTDRRDENGGRRNKNRRKNESHAK